MPPEHSRRGLLGLAGGLSAAAAGGALLTGCGPGADAGSSTPKRGGTVRAVFPGAGVKETMDPHAQRQFVDIARHKAVFDKLVDLDATLRPVPRLAERWSANGDGTVWRLTLRRARFHDGHLLDGDDVLFSLARILDPKAADRRAKESLAPVLDLPRCRRLGPRTVELALKGPNAELPALLAMTGTAVVREGYRDPARPVGTGPFRFRSFTAGRSFAARRFDDHWAGAPYPDGIRVLSAETEARANAVQAGEVEYAHEMSATFARLAEGNPRIRVVAAPHAGADAVAAKTDRPPFDDPRAALALKLLVDRERLVEVVSGGRAALGNDMFGKGFAYYPADVPQRGRDVAEARRLLRRSGALGRRVTFYTSTAADGFVAAAHLFAEQAGEAGLRVDVVTGPPDTYFTDQLTTGTLGNHRCGAMPIPTYLGDRMLTRSPQNATAWKHRDFDAAFDAARSTMADERRRARYAALQRRVRDEGGLVMWGHSDWLNAVAVRLHGVAAAPPNTVDWARFDTVWLG
ncbi:ABC transporter substrate-binding protein [Streptomyces sp. NPDC050560]|uniref:ABC transporter substrate-binding protein n=1 Tax=Streptomyces sp. NPDC050560 TaxID=3365630 RepID=UPI0037B55BA7